MGDDAAIAEQVLVVDDDLAFQHLVESVLHPAGVSTRCVRTAEEALAAVEGGRPRAVLLDGLLPGLRGDALALRLRARWPKGELPIVFASAFFRDQKSRARLFEHCQVDQVLHKPLSPEDLKRALSRVPGLVPAADAPAPDGLELDLPTAVELLTDYLVLCRERVAGMRRALGALGRRDGVGPALELLVTEAHRFHGSGRSYGLPEVSRLGETLETALLALGAAPPTAAQLGHLSGLAEALAARLARAEASTPSPGTPGAARGFRVILIDGAGALARSCAEAASEGLPVRLCADVESALGAFLEEPADVVFVAGDRLGLSTCRALVDAGVGPVVLLASDDSLSARLDAQAAGARGYVHRPRDAASLLRLAPDFAASPRGLSVVALGDDKQALARLAEGLLADGLSVTPCLAPRELFEVLDAGDPALLLFSTRLQGVDGAALLRAVRADARYVNLPIIALVAEASSAQRTEAFAAGADDVLPREGDPAELLSRVRAQVRRRVRERREHPLATLHGFPSEAALLEELGRALSLARRGRALSLLVFEARGPALRGARGRLEADAAAAALGAQLKQLFRTSDVVACLSPSRFGVLLHDAPREEAQRLLATHLERLNAPAPSGEALPAPVRGALASFPELTGTARELLAAAQAALSTQP